MFELNKRLINKEKKVFFGKKENRMAGSG